MYTVTTNKPILNGTNRSYVNIFAQLRIFFSMDLSTSVLFDYTDL